MQVAQRRTQVDQMHIKLAEVRSEGQSNDLHLAELRAQLAELQEMQAVLQGALPSDYDSSPPLNAAADLLKDTDKLKVGPYFLPIVFPQFPGVPRTIPKNPK